MEQEENSPRSLTTATAVGRKDTCSRPKTKIRYMTFTSARCVVT
jgi:hypothetical protein